MLFEFDGLPYLMLFAVVALAAFVELTVKDKVLRAYLFFVSGVLVIAFVALRWEVGTDWDNYLSFFLSKVNKENSQFDYYFDTGYTLLSEVVALITNKYSIFLLVSTVLSSGLIFFLLYRYTPNPCLGLLVFVGNYLPIHFVGSIRRSIAISLLCVLIYALASNKKRIVSLSLFFAAFIFHKTSIAALPFYLTKSRPFTTKRIVVILAVGLALGSLNISEYIMNTAANFMPQETNIGLFVTVGSYSGETYKEHTPESINAISQSFLALAKRYVLVIFFYIAIARRVSHNAIEGRIYNIYVLGVFLYSLFIGAPILQILSVYYLIFEVFLSSYAATRLRGGYRLIFLSYVVLMSLLSYQSGLSVYPELFFPYKSIIH